MELFKIKNTDSLLRDYYKLSEAAALIGCDEKDIIWYGYHKDIEICMEFYDDHELDVSSGINVEMEESALTRKINSLPKDDYGYFTLSENSSIRLNIDDAKYDNYGCLLCNMKGYFALDKDYKEMLIKYEGEPDEWPEYFIPSGESNFDSPIKLYINYDEKENFILIDTLWITKSQIGEFLKAVVEDKNKPKKNYKSQSEAQKQKHAVPRSEILMAVVSLFHRDMRLRRESPSAVTEHLFLHAHEFWPEKGEPPLSYETIVSLLRSCMKKDGLTFN